MIPSQTQPNAKRKADFNPLLAAAKRGRKESKGVASNKRKHHGEEQPGGLRIVRAPDTVQDEHASTNPFSRPTAGPSKPPTKKFRAEPDSDAPPPKSKPRERVYNVGPTITTRTDPEVDEDVRQMQDEAEDLRRRSRHNMSTSNTTALDIPYINHRNQASARQTPPASSARPKSRPKSKPPSSVAAVDPDTSLILPISNQESPQIARNKLMREGYSTGPPLPPEESERSGRSAERGDGSGHRRRSSIGSRGKRISGQFEATGVISQPHSAVSDSSFFKHIDVDLPEVERLRQLLIWSASRSASNTTSKPSSSSKDPPRPLPPASAQQIVILKNIYDDTLRRMAEKRIDISPYHRDGGVLDGLDGVRTQKENAQNVKNRQWEIIYGEQIERAKSESEAWKEVDFFYDAYAKAAKARIDKKREPIADAIPQTQTEREQELKRRLQSLEFDLDQLHTSVNAAMRTTEVVEDSLSHRFALLSLNLATRSNGALSIPGGSAGQHLLSKAGRVDVMDPEEILRALAWVDSERPKAMMGDAARRAAREVHRVEESGITERRLTGVPPTPSRKMPGTPRRGNTPARER